jgi:transcriptional regulator with XRE-family HTH domain
MIYKTKKVFYMIHFYLPFSHLRRQRRLSERDLADRAALSRSAVRGLANPAAGNVTVGSIDKLAACFECDVDIVLSGKELFSEYSTVATAYKIARDGFESWKIHLFDFVDEFRRAADARLVLLPPPSSSDQRIVALLSSVVRALCEELGMDPPGWASRRYFLASPWFVSGMNSLKASALLEAPLPFRANNIFVHENFLARA